jgi:hypothetical protein
MRGPVPGKGASGSPRVPVDYPRGRRGYKPVLGTNAVAALGPLLAVTAENLRAPQSSENGPTRLSGQCAWAAEHNALRPLLCQRPSRAFTDQPPLQLRKRWRASLPLPRQSACSDRWVRRAFRLFGLVGGDVESKPSAAGSEASPDSRSRELRIVGPACPATPQPIPRSRLS